MKRTAMISATALCLVAAITSREALTAAGIDPPPKMTDMRPGAASDAARVTVGTYFSCVLPRGWYKEEGSPLGLSADEKGVHGASFATLARGEYKPTISINHYAAGNLLYRSVEHYLKVFTPVVNGESSSPSGIQRIVVAGKPAWLFDRTRNEFRPMHPHIDPNDSPQPADPRVYESRREIMARKLAIRERFVVIPGRQDFIAMRFSAAEAEYAELLPAVVQVQESLKIPHG